MRAALLASATLAGTSMLFGCGEDGPLAASPAPDALFGDPLMILPPEVLAAEPTAEVVEVQSLDNVFLEQEIKVASGTEVRWVNAGRNVHDVQPVDLGAVWGVGEASFPPGAEYSFVFDEPGEYPYYCSLHGTETVGMIGTITVEG